MTAKNLIRFRVFGLLIAVVLAILFKEKLLLIAGVYWGLVILFTIALRFLNPDEYDKLKSNSDASLDEEEALSEDLEEAETSADESEEDDDGGLRDSYLEGKHSFAILAATFLLVLIGGIVFLVVTGVPYDENQVYFAKESFFNRTIGDLIIFQLAPLGIAAVLTGAGCVSIYEILTGVATAKEKRRYRLSLGKSIVLATGPVILAFAMVFAIQNWATVLTEDGIEIYRPGKEAVCYQWEDMQSFSCDEEDAFSWPELDVEFQNGTKMNIYFGHFERISRKAKEVYKPIWEGDTIVIEGELFIRHIFREKYAHLNNADSQE